MKLSTMIFLFILSILFALASLTWKILAGIIVAFLLTAVPVSTTLVWTCFGFFVASGCCAAVVKISMKNDD